MNFEKKFISDFYAHSSNGTVKGPKGPKNGKTIAEIF